MSPASPAVSAREAVLLLFHFPFPSDLISIVGAIFFEGSLCVITLKSFVWLLMLNQWNASFRIHLFAPVDHSLEAGWFANLNSIVDYIIDRFDELPLQLIFFTDSWIQFQSRPIFFLQIQSKRGACKMKMTISTGQWFGNKFQSRSNPLSSIGA